MASDKDVEVDAELDEDELAEPGEDALLEKELDVDDLDPDALDPDVLEDDVLEDDVLGDDLEDEGDAAVVTAVPTPSETPVDSDEAISDDDDEIDDDDVEASLDVILKERLVVAEEEDEDDDEDEAADVEDRADGTTRVLPKQPGEFVCQSCFLVKSEHQLADQKRMLCRDCV